MLDTGHTSILSGQGDFFHRHKLFIRKQDIYMAKIQTAMKNCMLLLMAMCVATMASAQRPALVSHTPVTGASQVLTTVPITITFNKPVTKGSGNIYLRNRTLKATTNIAASSANVSVSGSSVTISNLGLIAGCYYHVTFDSTAFDSASYHCTGLYDTSTWWFRTGGTGVGVGSVNAPNLSLNLEGNADGQFIISCSIPQAATLSVRVYDMNGRETITTSFVASGGNNRLPLHTSLQPGMYIIVVDDGRNYGLVKATLP
jgi:hypothetical protein